MNTDSHIPSNVFPSDIVPTRGHALGGEDQSLLISETLKRCGLHSQSNLLDVGRLREQW